MTARRLLAIAALVLALALAGCGPPGPARDRYDAALGRGEVRGVRDVTVLATRDTLIAAGREALEAGRWAVAASRFEAVLVKHPGDGEATALLGLCRWFEGRPGAMRAMWESWPGELPGFAAALSENAAALTLLADRLRARGIVAEARAGLAPPLARGLAVATAPVVEPGAAPLPIPRTERALHLLWLDALAGYDAPRALPRGLLAALAAEAGGAGAGPREALALARAVGAEFAVSATIGPAPEDPGLIRTRIVVLPAEDPAARRERLGREAEEAAKAATEALQALGALDRDLALTAFGMAYFETRERLDAQLAERAALEQSILELNRAGSLTAAAISVARLEALERSIAATVRELREREQAAVGLAEHVFVYNAASLAERDASLRAARVKLEDRAVEAAQQAGAAYALASRTWPEDGVAARFDLAPGDLARWPGLAARAVARALGARRLPGTFEQAFAPGAGTPELAALDRALGAWDDGEYARALELWCDAAPLAPAAPSAPGPDFDLLSQAAMGPKDIAALYAARLTAAHEAARAELRLLDLPRRAWQ